MEGEEHKMTLEEFKGLKPGDRVEAEIRPKKIIGGKVAERDADRVTIHWNDNLKTIVTERESFRELLALKP
jgi:bifunctional DNA-binding transcriptional regulator/antitoxin component of YhaV-PrlF toxin-antitoxin module